MILQNVAGLVSKAIDLDKDVMKSVAAYRGGIKYTDAERTRSRRNWIPFIRGLTWLLRLTRI